ncbi:MULTISPECIES: TonB-dependent receptor plug domain-containing protein [unclassified Corallococcus]|uniref:TonB-dependent receptor plug domain-containing protein n=1 Tax=unclassified Corallococcus TaxID=2685029 RepID=UPI001A8C8B21|nr:MULTISPECIES: TonB-dependent receptor [unclassified Corallococcus]MBN9682334.1 TonB-dependent receptor [Corallococcus sp. NCSPR001]WAS86112.1 TonB-dependent receptor [Corallococcus sp. NCRR]
MSRSLLARTVVGLALGFQAQALAGQETPASETPLPEFVLPTVEVIGEEVPEAPVDSARRRDPTGAITIIDARERAGEARDTAELLGGSASLVVQDSGGYGQSKSLVVRGASSNGVLVFLDGIPLNGAGGAADLSLIPVALLERMEILRGAAGARYGAGGLGGAVNLVTRAPSSRLLSSGEVTYGSFDTVMAHVAASGALLEGQALVLLHGGRSQGDFSYRVDELPALDDNPLTQEVRTRNDARGGGALLKYRHGLDGGGRVDVLAELSLQDRALAGTVQNPTVSRRQDQTRLSLGARWARPFGDTGEGSARGFFRSDWLDVTGGTTGVESGAQRYTVGGAEVEGRAVLGRNALAVTLAGSSESVTQAVGGQAASWWRASVMAMDELSLFSERLKLVPSVRVERVGHYSLLSPKLGASVDLGRGFGVRANAGQSHRAPSFLELYIRQGLLLPNPELKPERALSVDAAALWRDDVWSVTAGGFAAVYENLIAYELYPPNLARPYNFAAARVWGAEVELEVRPRAWLTATSSYAWTRTQNRYGDPRYFGKELPYRPRHKWVGRLRVGPDWLNGRTEVLVQSSQLINRVGEARLSLPSRTWVSVGASSTFLHRPDLTVSFDVKNLLDARTADYTGMPLPGRAAYVTLSVALDPSPSEDSHVASPP